MHRFLCGVENLNLMLQEQLNPKKNQDELKYSSQTFRVGDKVMHIRNNYQKMYLMAILVLSKISTTKINCRLF